MPFPRPAALARSAIVLFLSVLFGGAAAAQPEGSVQRSPYTAVEFRGERARVLIGDAWYELEALGVKGGRRLEWTDLKAAAESAFQHRWQERVAMDLDAVIEAAGARVGDTVTVWASPVEAPDSAEVGAVVHLPGVAHTTRNRAAARDYYREAEERHRLDAVVDTKHALLQVAMALGGSHAQAMRLGVDWNAATMAEIERIGERATGAEVIRAAQRLVALSGDGHAEVREFAETLPPGYLPLALVWVGDEWRGQHPGAGSWVWPAGARDVRIDGVPVADWVEAVRPYVAAGSEHLVRRRSGRLSQRAMFVRELLGVAKGTGDAVEVSWLPAHGQEPQSFRAALAERPARGEVPNTIPLDEHGVGFAWREAPNGKRVGCVRIATMGSGSSFSSSLRAAIAQALTADAMLIDVRGNGGGDRDALLILLPYLMEQDALVFNLARPRLAAFARRGSGDDLLTDRYLRPAAWVGWHRAERAAVDAALRDVRPSWSPTHGWEREGFGDWYAGVVGRERHGPPAEAGAAPRFAGPVVVLLDDGCFSATDIFLGAMEQLPNVTLVGTPSGGGSARKTRVRVHGPPAMELGLASIASFRPDGRAYDGAGIEPDILAEPMPEDYEGKNDTVMATGLRVAGEKP